MTAGGVGPARRLEKQRRFNMEDRHGSTIWLKSTKTKGVRRPSEATTGQYLDGQEVAGIAGCLWYDCINCCGFL